MDANENSTDMLPMLDMTVMVADSSEDEYDTRDPVYEETDMGAIFYIV